MFDYELKDKQVLLILNERAVADLEPFGITGSPIYAKVHSVEQNGLWLDNPSFPLCPIDKPHLYDARGNAFCHAHVFVPAAAVVSLAALTEPVDFGAMEGLNRIGFRTVKKA